MLKSGIVSILESALLNQQAGRPLAWDEVTITKKSFVSKHPSHKGLVVAVPATRFRRYRVMVVEPGPGHAFPNPVAVKAKHLSVSVRAS